MRLHIFVWTMISASFLSADATPEAPLTVFPKIPQYRALLQHGRQALDQGRPESAAADFRSVLGMMMADRLAPGVMFPVRIALATAYLESGDLRHAEESLLEATRSQTGTMSDLAAVQLANNWGSLHLKRGRCEQARKEFADALIRVEGNPAGWPLTATLFDNLSAAEIALRLYPEALIHQQEAIRRWQVWLPAGHPDMIKAYASLATAQYFSNNATAAQASMRTAIDSARRSFGDRSPLLADLLESQAIILRRLGLKREARAASTEARRISRPKTNGSSAYTVDYRSLISTH
jgi:tetratricopeptide (TPR) repeat protein